MKEGVCPKCGTQEVIPRILIWTGPGIKDHPSVIIEEKPGALILNKSMIFKIRAWICGQCGYTELYTDSPQELKESFQRRIANKKAKKKK